MCQPNLIISLISENYIGKAAKTAHSLEEQVTNRQQALDVRI